MVTARRPPAAVLHALPPPLSVLHARLAGIERELDAGTYRPGQWASLIHDVKRLPQEDRAAMSEELTRASRKLHLRKPRRIVSATAALMLEFAAIILGMVLLAVGIVSRSNLAMILGALLWMAALEPVIKILIASIFGIDYEYAYFAFGEPRFKMKYGTYIAAPRSGRVITHLAGMVGSPVGMLAGYLLARVHQPPLAVAESFCWVVLWVVIGTNLAGLLFALSGRRRIGPLRLEWGSGGSAGIELHEGFAR